MASLTQDTSERPGAPPQAGGGGPSTVTEFQTVPHLSSLVRTKIKSIYNSQSTSRNAVQAHGDTVAPQTLAEFESWFQTSEASAIAPPTKHDLSYPITSYFISSSHNTYLSGNQLYGIATGEAYQNVLIRGCRCLEIDVWNGDDENSSASSSDMEEYGHNTKLAQPEGKRERANSALSRFTHRFKEKATAVAYNRIEHDPTYGVQTDTGLSAAEVQRLKSEPKVKHGYTLTKEIPFRTVCHAIKDSAFIATDLPVIVSLEVHCSFEQQQIMVDILREAFKDHLVNISGQDQANIRSLPSPDELRNKILIKVKWSPPNDSGESNNPLETLHSGGTTSADETSSNPEKKKKASKILHALSALGIYTRAYSFKHFDQPEAKFPNHVFSLSEAKVEDIHADVELGPRLFEHNKNFLMRVFPSGLRINSSNVEPCFPWRQGAQMVALNWQKLDSGMMLNEGMFAGEQGWVLKPEGFRGRNVKHDANQQLTASPNRQLLDLEIELFASQGLPLPLEKDSSHLSKMKPYVKVQLHVDTHGPPGRGSASGSNSDSHSHVKSRYTSLHRGHSDDNEDDEDEDTRRLKRKSKTSRSADADFGGEILRWSGIHDVVDELSFLRLKINDDHTIGKDDLIAWACIKLSRLREGYRFVHLLDANGRPCSGVLLVKIKKTLK